MGQDHQPRLIRVDTPERVEYPIAEGTSRIGRSRGFQICLEDRAVSRFHCYLQREGDTVRIFNGESKNPARVNGEEVRGQVLRSGHSIRVGHCELVYEGPLPTVEEAPPEPTAESAPARVAARRTPAFTPRRPPARRGGARVPVGWIVTGLIAFPLLVWLVVAYLPKTTETPRAAPDTGQAAAARLRRLEEELGRLRGELTGKLAQKEPGRAESEHVASLAQRIKELEGELSRQRSEAPAADRADPAGAGALAAADGDFALPDADLDSAEQVASLDDLRAKSGGTTVVATDSSRRVERSPREIRDLVTKLTARLDDYATHLVTPAKLDPELRDLSLSLGKAAAEGLLDVYDHARQLLRVTDASIGENERRREAMLKKAAAAPQPAPGKGPDRKDAAPRKPGEYEKPVSQQVEVDQRLLDLFAKAASIHRQHRTILVSLREAILKALGRLTDTEAVRRLRTRFADESGDPELCAAIAAAMKDSGLRESIPALYRKLGVSGDAPLKAAIRGALVALAGKDLGAEAPAWAQWWVEEGSK